MKLFFLLLFWSLWYLNFSAKAIISPIMPLIEDEFHISHAMAGGLFFSFWIGNTISIFYAGFLSLKIGYKRSIFLSFLFMAAIFVVLRFVPTYFLFAVTLFVLGLGAGIYLPCGIPLLTAVFRKDNWGRAISFHETAAGFSFLTVPIIIVWAISFADWKSIFLIMSGACIFVSIVLQIFSPDPRPEKSEKVSLSVILHRKDFWIMTVLWCSCAAASLGIFNIIPLYLVKERSIQIEAANTIFSISRIGGLIAMISIGFIIDRFNLKKLIFGLLLATGLTTVGIAVIENYWILSIMLFLQATFSVVFFPAGLVAIAKMTTLGERSVFTGILMSISGIIGPGLSPIILGAIADVWNFQVGILGFGIIMILICLLTRELKDI